MKSKKTLSKSRLKEGLQCPKFIYLSVNKPEVRPEVSPATQQQFDEGNEVGELAREHFGKGALVKAEYYEIDKALKQTDEHVKSGAKTIFEASFSDGKFYCRVDILARSSTKSKWRVIEVKKSLEISDAHIEDLAIQAAVLENCGVKVESYELMYLYEDCEYPDLSDLFITDDVTDLVKEKIPEIKKSMLELERVVRAKKAPDQKIGKQCEKPYPCAFKDHCWKHIPDFSIFDLPGVGPVKGLKMMEQGQLEIKKLNHKDFNDPIRRVIEVTKSGKRFINPKGVARELKYFKYPLYSLDFETLRPAIPRFKGDTPYTQFPYQFSCHVRSKPGAKVEHFEYLHLDNTDPREPLAKALVDGIGSKGSVVAYNMGFESGVLKDLADRFPKYRSKLLDIESRLVDPLPVFREHVYDKEFRGSFSLKDVSPGILGNKYSYDEMDVGDGKDAGAMADQILRGFVKGDDFKKIKADLLKYCRQDTMAVAELVEWLHGVAK